MEIIQNNHGDQNEWNGRIEYFEKPIHIKFINVKKSEIEKKGYY